MGQYFNSFLSSSLNRLTPMCNDSAVDSAVTPMCNDGSGTTPMCNDSGPRVYSPTYPMNHQPSSAHATSGKSCTSPSKAHRNHTSTTQHHGSSSVATDPDPRRPPLNPIKLKTSHRNRKKVGLSINVPTPSSDPHNIPSFHDGDHSHPPPISCSRNVELRRKSLSERHFFRPVSEDEESVRMGQQSKQ